MIELSGLNDSRNINFSPKVPLVYKPLWMSNPKRVKKSIKRQNLLNSLGIPSIDVINQYVLQSGRISGKTTMCREYILYRLITIDGANAVVTRAEGNDIRDTVFSGFIGLINEITNNHASDFFYIKTSPFSITYKVNGNQIYFLAINGNVNRSKGFELKRGYIDVIWHEEVNENDKAEFVDAADMTFLRFCKPCSKILYAFNTEQIRNHWSNSFFKDKIKSGEAIRIYATWKDIYKYLDTITIQKIMDDRERNIDYYRYWYLGHMVGLSGLVFPQFNRNRHLVKQINPNIICSSFASVIIAIDAANKNDATSANLLGILIDGRILVLDALYYEPMGRDGQRDIGQKDDLEMVEIICRWWNTCLGRYQGLGEVPTYGIVDNANWSIMSLLQRSNTLNYVHWQSATDKVILRDTKRLQNLLGKDMILFNNAPYNDVHCGIEEIESYVYDEKTREIKLHQQDHFIDALKYGTYAYAYPDIYKLNA